MNNFELPYKVAILVSGPPGVGKDTQCNMLAERYGIMHVIMSDLLKMEELCPHGHDHSLTTAEMNKGVLLSDEVVHDVQREWLYKQSEQPRKMMCNGWARSIGQDKLLRRFLKGLNYYVITAHFHATDSVCLSRLTHRLHDALAKGQEVREDDRFPEDRLRRYRETTLPMINMYRQDPKRFAFFEVDCNTTDFSLIAKHFEDGIVQKLQAKRSKVASVAA